VPAHVPQVPQSDLVFVVSQVNGKEKKRSGQIHVAGRRMLHHANVLNRGASILQKLSQLLVFAVPPLEHASQAVRFTRSDRLKDRGETQPNRQPKRPDKAQGPAALGRAYMDRWTLKSLFTTLSEQGFRSAQMIENL